GPLTLREIKRALPGEVRPLERRVGRATYRSTNINVVLQALVRQGLVGSEKGRGATSTLGANRYFLLRQLSPDLNLEAVPPEEARIELLRHYIRAFGPVSVDDCAWWMGERKVEVRKALEELAEELVTVEIAGLGDGWLMLEPDYEKFLEFEPPEGPVVALLPYEDPYPKGYKRRERLIAPELEKRAYPGGSVRPTVIVDGRIIGLWEADVERGRESPTLQLFEGVSPAMQVELGREAEALDRFISSLGGGG
ncbi:MAG: DNA glycosylase AlkZ-like family protein, partial [Candidatus Bipolaricaulia bacterium]